VGKQARCNLKLIRCIAKINKNSTMTGGGDVLLALLTKDTGAGASLARPAEGGVNNVVAIVARYRAGRVVLLILYLLEKLS
jgi:hypothetical protein